MINKINSLGNWMLDQLLPKASAAAAPPCQGTLRSCVGSCCYYCRQWSPSRCTYYRSCDWATSCEQLCHDCCC
ncbi:hypothetical protein [Nonomuraea jiangxiensis]|uniref:Uncharacterized protein n=1 Tax=Nonomuraea jiangxiensis TaxID=633440 RepID=A0A1G8JA95_9ACTN|nr:hypothetical protein [Nonomuraea jiangxiensis]SDI28002.1 hypothetical protein SAMN05421869_10527 [Nonomuraea jiangxiensis]